MKLILAFVLVVAPILAGCDGAPTSPATPTPTATPVPPPDFKALIVERGERCDSIRSTEKTDETWRVICEPGYAYDMRFDASGAMTYFKLVGVPMTGGGD